MNITSVHPYFWNGEAAVPQNHLRASHPADETKLLDATNRFKGEVEVIQSSPEKIAFIDGAVRIATVPDSVRQQAQTNWSQLAKKSDRTFKATLIVGCITCVLLIGIVFFVVAARAYSRREQAENRLKEWKDPVAEASDFRRQAGVLGFNYVNANPRSQFFFHEDEISHLWYNNLEAFIGKLAPNIEHGIISAYKEFFDENPFDKKALNTAFKDKSATTDSLAKEYSNLKGNFNDLMRGFSDERESVERKTKEEIRKLKTRKKEALKCIESIRAPNEILRAELTEKRYDPVQKRNVYVVTHQRKAEIGGIIARNEASYRLAAAPIHIMYDNLEREVKKQAQNALEAVNQREEKQILTFKPAILDLLEKFVWVLKPVEPLVIKGASAPDLMGNPQPSAPPMEKE